MRVAGCKRSLLPVRVHASRCRLDHPDSGLKLLEGKDPSVADGAKKKKRSAHLKNLAPHRHDVQRTSTHRKAFSVGSASGCAETASVLSIAIVIRSKEATAACQSLDSLPER